MKPYVGKPADSDLAAYLNGLHGRPSPEAVQIIQDALERAVHPDTEGER